MTSATELFLQARNILLKNRTDYERACREFKWPVFEHFNWALDWFDIFARGNSACGLWVETEHGEQRLTFAELLRRSSQVATFLRKLGIGKNDRILMMLPNVVPLWELMLAAMKVGAVLVPTAVQATSRDIVDRINRSSAKVIITDHEQVHKFSDIRGRCQLVVTGPLEPGWINLDEAYSCSSQFFPSEKTLPDDPFLLYFTSGTTSKPKLVCHTHQSYAVGHLSTLYWLGIQTGDIHYNISSPGWAKHAWSSFFAPWNVGATIFVRNYDRFDAQQSIELLDRNNINTLCAPPTVWRLLIQEHLGLRPKGLRELCSAGEPLNPEIIEHVQRSWGLTIRDGYGQTETTAQIGNAPGQKLKPGSMGRALPGYQIVLLDAQGQPSQEGEIAISLEDRPAGLMKGYADVDRPAHEHPVGQFYRTGDEAKIDEDGYLWFIGRGDDVFKSSDYRISPFELESVLMEHEAVAEAAVVPSVDPIRLYIPKAFVKLKSGISPDDATAQGILTFVNAKLASYQKIRRIEFCELPKTISGKIRRSQLRKEEQARSESNMHRHFELRRFE